MDGDRVARTFVLSVLAVLMATSASRAQDEAIGGPVNVTVDVSKAGNFMAPRAMGIHTSVYDNAFHGGQWIPLLKKDGIYTLRYPGGGYSDAYHWSTAQMSAWKGTKDKGYVAQGDDFGSFVRLLDKLGGTAVITVDYGANLQGTGPGEPAEAAAWVAYANGKPDDPKVIGKDSVGNDWKTVGYWAAMRASTPLDKDDGYNFLRIGHPAQVNIKYWEIGNELFGNGYYAKDNAGYEHDAHAAYSGVAKDDARTRAHNPKLSPAAYGEGVAAFSRAMKAVDPRIGVGAVLNTPPADYTWGRDWNSAVLKACAQDIDFVIIHWYTGGLLPPDYKKLDAASFLNAPFEELPQMTSELLDSFKQYAGGKQLQLAVTELGSRPYAQVENPVVEGLFAADSYASLAEDGAINIDWLELHSNVFLDAKDDGPRAGYFGIQMVHKLMNPRDVFVKTTSSNHLLAAHAARRADGSLGLMLINKDPKNVATVRVKVSGPAVGAVGKRFQWGPVSPPTQYDVQEAEAPGLGNSFAVTVPAYSITVLNLPMGENPH